MEIPTTPNHTLNIFKGSAPNGNKEVDKVLLFSNHIHNEFIVATIKKNHKRIRPKAHKVLIWGIFHRFLLYSLLNH